MHMLRHLDSADPSELLHPAFRTISFGGDRAMITVSTYLRTLWTAAPPDDTSVTSVSTYMKSIDHLSQEEREAQPQSLETRDVHTPWRDSLYYLWNHVFVDVANFLQEAASGIGYFHPPSHEALGLCFAQAKTEGNVAPLVKSWDTNVLLLPGYLASGVSLQGVVCYQGEIEKPLGVFHELNHADIWFIRKNVTIKVHMHAASTADPADLAAVLVVGKFCANNEHADGTSDTNGQEESGSVLSDPAT